MSTPEPLTAPPIIGQDASDPLAPIHLRTLHLSAEAAILVRDEIERLARDPEQERAWQRAMRGIRAYRVEAAAHLANLEAILADERALKTLALNAATIDGDVLKILAETDDAIRATEAEMAATRSLIDRLGPSGR